MEELKRHKIVEANVRHIHSRYPRLIGRNAVKDIHGYGRDGFVSDIRTDTGIYGWGLADKPNPATPSIIGKTLAEVFAPQSGPLTPGAAPFEFALYDVAGKIAGAPVYKMLAGNSAPTSPAVRAYDAAIYIDDVTPDGKPAAAKIVLDNCRRGWDRGFRDFKLKIGRGNKWMPPEAGLRRDIELTRAVRELYPASRILVDGNDGFTVESFLKYFDGVADCGLYWIEEPFAENREGLLRLRDAVSRKSPKTLLADGELRPDINLLLSLCREKLLDVLLMDVFEFGFGAYLRLIPALKEMGTRISPHAWGVSLKTNYSAQLSAVTGLIDVIEGVTDEVEGVDKSGYVLTDGMLSVPDAPGWGMSLEWARPVTQAKATLQ